MQPGLAGITAVIGFPKPSAQPPPPSPPTNIVPHLQHEYVRVIQDLIGFDAVFPRELLEEKPIWR